MQASDFPTHVSLELHHNKHKSTYETVQRCIANEDVGYDCWVSDDEEQKAIKTDECWYVLWYPNTPVGFRTMAASDLDVLLGWMRRFTVDG